MSTCTAAAIAFSRCQRRQVQAEFSGGTITSDGGVRRRQVDQRIGLTERLAQALPPGPP